MLYLGRPRDASWVVMAFVPSREVFASAEQVAGQPPYSFRVVDDASAEVVQDLVNGFFGQWHKPRYPRNRIRIECRELEVGTQVSISAHGDRGAIARATNLIRILSQGEQDTATVYRYRAIPPGACTVVQSWAGTGYPVYLAPDHGAARGRPVRPASHLVALEQRGRWVRVRAGEDPDAQEGWIEADQLVPDHGPLPSGVTAD